MNDAEKLEVLRRRLSALPARMDDARELLLEEIQRLEERVPRPPPLPSVFDGLNVIGVRSSEGPGGSTGIEDLNDGDVLNDSDDVRLF